MKLPQIYRPKRRLRDDVAPFESNDADSWEEDGPSRATRVRKVLVVSLIFVAVFLGGVQVQKQWGDSGSAASGMPAGLPAGLSSGGMPGGMPSAGGSSSPSDTSDSPAVIGTITKVDGQTVTVTDVSGTKHIVELDKSTSMTRSQKVTSTDLDSGESVTVTGTTDRDGRITAKSLTLR